MQTHQTHSREASVFELNITLYNIDEQYDMYSSRGMGMGLRFELHNQHNVMRRVCYENVDQRDLFRVYLHLTELLNKNVSRDSFNSVVVEMNVFNREICQ